MKKLIITGAWPALALAAIGGTFLQSRNASAANSLNPPPPPLVHVQGHGQRHLLPRHIDLRALRGVDGTCPQGFDILENGHHGPGRRALLRPRRQPDPPRPARRLPGRQPAQRPLQLGDRQVGSIHGGRTPRPTTSPFPATSTASRRASPATFTRSRCRAAACSSTTSACYVRARRQHPRRPRAEDALLRRDREALRGAGVKREEEIR